MRTALLSLTFLLAGSMAAPAIAHTAAPKKKVTATTKKGKILPMKEYIDQLMAKMTLQEKIGQLNLMVAGDTLKISGYSTCNKLNLSVCETSKKPA